MVLWGDFSHPNSNNWNNNSTIIYQHKQNVFGWLCVMSYPNIFLRPWGRCHSLHQHRWGPLRPHNTAACAAISQLVLQLYYTCDKTTRDSSWTMRLSFGICNISLCHVAVSRLLHRVSKLKYNVTRLIGYLQQNLQRALCNNKQIAHPSDMWQPLPVPVFRVTSESSKML